MPRRDPYKGFKFRVKWNGMLVKRYLVHRAWISEYVAVSDLDSNVSEIALTRITIEHEGWERDRAVAPPED